MIRKKDLQHEIQELRGALNRSTQVHVPVKLVDEKGEYAWVGTISLQELVMLIMDYLSLEMIKYTSKPYYLQKKDKKIKK